MRRCAYKRVKRRDIFYIYGYLPLLCSRTGGLRQRANRRPSFTSFCSLLSPPSLAPSASSSFRPVPVARVSSFFLRRRGEFSVQDAAQPAAGPCVISDAIPYSVPTMICSRLVPRSRWILFIYRRARASVCIYMFVPYLYIDAGCRAVYIHGTASTIRIPKKVFARYLASFSREALTRVYVDEFFAHYGVVLYGTLRVGYLYANTRGHPARDKPVGVESPAIESSRMM